jgi:hypothetical protein
MFVPAPFTIFGSKSLNDEGHEGHNGFNKHPDTATARTVINLLATFQGNPPGY